MSQLNIRLVPAKPSDYPAISKLVEPAFAYDEFGVLAFGPKRFTPAGSQRWEKKMAAPSKPGETKYEMKAVTVLPDGIEEIVGYAWWTICVGRSGSEEEKMRMGAKEGWALQNQEIQEKMKEIEGEGFGNPKVRKDVVEGIEKILARSTEGKDYMALEHLIVVPGYQRRGIGVMLFEDGLKVADGAGLQVVLGASPQGAGLYKKYGCIEVDIMKVNLWEYEGGDGLGVSAHSILRRPPNITKRCEGDIA